MSQDLVAFVHEFLGNPYDCSEFCDDYIRRWKEERGGTLTHDDARTSEALSTIFCLADLFNPCEDREDYELDEQGLRLKVSEAIRGCRPDLPPD
ncbi:MAG: colicin immunity domain-containing protein [Burkholderiaceae bacterium]|jgi:hypothetical protein|nr:colicin immunity domain-containing protein [Burkholderiaceae bacterium]